MKIVFRVDASSIIGTGHVMRCLALAQGVESAGGKAIFICRELAGHLCEEITARGFAVLRLPGNTAGVAHHDCNGPVHELWLGTSWQQDVVETRVILERLAPVDWLVVDHYALDARWESALRPLAKQLMAIDDLFDRTHDVDLLLNHNIPTGSSTNYSELVLKTPCRLLLGPSYALLQSCYEELHSRIPPRKGKIERVLVYFGGVDAANLTGRSLEALLAAGCEGLDIDVVLPVVGPHTEQIRALSARLPKVHIHEALPSLAQIIASADLAIGAGGTTSWERLCLGLPTLIVTLSDNQIMIARALKTNNLAQWLGHHDEVTVKQLADALRTILKQGLSPDWSARCRATVDGAGVRRVVAFLALSARSQLKARLAKVDDEALVCNWLTLPTNVGNASYERMLRTLGNDRLYMVEAAPGVITGAVLCSNRDNAWQLRTQLSPAVGLACPVQNMEEAVLRQVRASMDGLLQFTPDFIAKGKSLHITLCSDKVSWINNFIPVLVLKWLADGHTLSWAHDAAILPESQVCFYLSYGRIVGIELRARHGNNLVVHESDLPKGRGWSPLSWQVLEGAGSIVVTLLEAADEVDTGAIYSQTVINLHGDELVEDLRRLQALATFELCTDFLAHYPSVLLQAQEQHGTPSYFPRRTQVDSRIDPNLPLRDQFNLLRICDNISYPAWFEYAGARYALSINRVKQNDNET